MRRNRRTETETAPAAAEPIEVQPHVNGAAPAIAETSAQEKLDFFDQLQQYEPSEWRHHKIYIYRVWPRIEKQADTHYLTVVSSPVDEEWVKMTFGSGRYQLLLKDTQAKKAVRSHVFTVHDLEYPPKLNAKEVLETEENSRYFDLWPPIRSKEPPTQSAEAAKAGDAAVSAAVHELGQIAREASQKTGLDENVMNLYLETSKAKDALVQQLAASQAQPDASVTSQLAVFDKVLSIIEKLKPEKETGATSQASAIDPLAALDKAVDLINKLKPAPAAAAQQPQQNGIAQMREMVELVGSLKDTFGGGDSGGGTGEGNWVRDLMQYGSEVLKGPLALLTQALLSRSMNPAGRSDTAPGPGMPGPTAPGGPSPTHVAQAPQARPMASATPGVVIPDAVIPAADIPKVSTEDMVLRGMFRQFAPALLTALNQGADGYAMAEAVITMNGRLAYDQISGIGKEKLLDLAKSDPEIWAQLATIEAKFNTFLEEFFSFDDELEEEQEDEEQTAPGPASRGLRKKAAAITE